MRGVRGDTQLGMRQKNPADCSCHSKGGLLTVFDSPHNHREPQRRFVRQREAKQTSQPGLSAGRLEALEREALPEAMQAAAKGAAVAPFFRRRKAATAVSTAR